MARDQARYLNRVFMVSVVVAACAAGTWAGLLELCRSGVGTGPTTTLLFCAVVLTSICLGLMSPQWLVRKLTRVTTRAQRWLRPTVSGQIPLLAARPVDAQMVATVLAGAIVLHALLSVGATMLADELVGAYHWLDGRFLLGFGGMRILDLLFMAALLGPAWFVVGIELALLHRLTLSAEHHSPRRIDYENNLPLWLLGGVVAGHVVWQLLLFDLLGPLYCLWLAQLPPTLAAILLIALAPAVRRRGRPATYRPPWAELEHVSGARWSRPLLVALFAVLAGASVSLLKHLAGLLWQAEDPQRGFDGLIVAAVAVGLLLVSRSGGKAKFNPLNYLPPLLVGWAGCTLLAVIGFSRLWLRLARGYEIASWYFWPMLAGPVFLGVVALTVGLGLGKQITQQAVVSKSLGWARWMTLLSFGFLLAWYLALHQLRGRMGSLMSLAALILVALLAGGLLALYQAKTKLRTMVLVGIFVLAGAAAPLLPALGRHWLQPQSSGAAMIVEADSCAWAIYVGRDDVLASINLAAARTGDPAVATAQSDRNAAWIKATLSGIRHRKVLVLGMEDNLWPLPSMSSDLLMDYLLEGNLARRLAQKKVLGQGNLVDVPLDLWSRSGRHYDLIWQRLTRDRGDVGGEEQYDVPWRQITRLLHPEGILLTQLDHPVNDTAAVSELAAEIAARFEGRGGVLTPTLPRSHRDVAGAETIFIIAFQSQGHWQRYQRSNQSALRENSPAEQIWKIYRISGSFRCFDELE